MDAISPTSANRYRMEDMIVEIMLDPQSNMDRVTVKRVLPLW
jgi:hypothetical protein